MCVTISLTVYLKYYVGRLRPDFLSRCELPNVALTNHTIIYEGYTTSECINQDSKVLKEGRVSYPSGHTSLAFCQGFYLLCYMLWALYVRPEGKKARLARLHRSRVHEQMIEVMRCMALFVGPAGALFVGASRLVDNKHHPSDVNAGEFASAGGWRGRGRMRG